MLKVGEVFFPLLELNDVRFLQLMGNPLRCEFEVVIQLFAYLQASVLLTLAPDLVRLKVTFT